MRNYLLILIVLSLYGCSDEMGACVESGSNRCENTTESSCTSNNYWPGDKNYTFYSGQTCADRGLSEVTSF